MSFEPMTAGALTDVAGLRVGHAHRAGRGWLTGTTVVLAPPGTVGGVDVRGGGPGTRETDLLRPENLIAHVHAICLTGGSAYGLAAADGVMAFLAERGMGFPVGSGLHEVVPIVPAAVIFDLGRGGHFDHRPDATFGYRAAGRATGRGGVDFRRAGEGSVGAGTGARAGGLRGGVGMASLVLDDGATVAALAVVNAVGRVIDGATGLPWVTDPASRLHRPTRSERAGLAQAAEAPSKPLNTTIGVVATDVQLDKAECTKLAQVAHDGLARAARPSHTMFDGDTIFALATGARQLSVPEAALPSTEAGGPPGFRPSARPAGLNPLLDAAARCFAIAVTRGVVFASPGGLVPCYRELCPSAFV